MSRGKLLSILHIGAITVETQDLFIAREVAVMIQAAPAADATEGVVSLDGRQIRWWRYQSNPTIVTRRTRQPAAR